VTHSAIDGVSPTSTEFFSVDVCLSPGEILVGLGGEFDMASAASLTSAITSALDGSDARSLVFDLGGVTFMDCTGLSCLMSGAARMRLRAGETRLQRPPPSVSRLLSVLHIRDTLLHRLRVVTADGSHSD
jgi:anti-anti-sigma factor